MSKIEFYRSLMAVAIAATLWSVPAQLGRPSCLRQRGHHVTTLVSLSNSRGIDQSIFQKPAMTGPMAGIRHRAALGSTTILGRKQSNRRGLKRTETSFIWSHHLFRSSYNWRARRESYANFSKRAMARQKSRIGRRGMSKGSEVEQKSRCRTLNMSPRSHRANIKLLQ